MAYTPKKPASAFAPAHKPEPTHEPIAHAVTVIPVEEPIPVAKAGADAQAARDAPKAPVKSPGEKLPPIPLNANGEPLFTPTAWLRKLKREGKVKG